MSEVVEWVCPICENDCMDGWIEDWGGLSIGGVCEICGFFVYTKRTQIDFEDMNDRRKDYNDNLDEGEEKLEMITKKEYNEWGKKIKKEFG